MDQFFTVRQAGKFAVVEFRTASLMNPLDLERVGSGLSRLVEADGHKAVLLDFTKVKYLSSQAIGIVLNLNRRLNAAGSGGGLVLCGVGSQLMQLLKITRLDRILTVKATQEEALAGESGE